jgi:hypothetical protein
MAQTNLQQPGGYAIEAGQAVMQQQQPGVQLGRTGIQGSTAVQQADQQHRQIVDTGTSDLLMKLGGKLLEPHIQRVQTQQFLEGAQRVAQGEALKDIVDEDPWYTQIFGPSSSTQGARAVAQMKGVDDYLTDVANNMPELQKLSSADFGKQITGKMQQFLTGDAVADTAIQLKMVEASGGLFKAHTKAHYKWTQDTMQSQIVSYMQTGGAKLKAMTGQLLEGTMTQKDYDEAKAVYVGNLMPLDGQSPASYWEAIESATIDALATGNHHAANAIFDSGIFNNAPVEQRKKMMDARHKYEAQTQETAGFAEYGPRIGQLKGMAAAGQLTGNQILAEVDKINNDYKLRYGIDRPLFKRKEMEAILSGNIASIYRRQEQDQRDLAREGRADRREAAKETVKVEMEARKQAQLVQIIQAGGGNMAALAGHSQTEIDNAVYTGATVIATQGGNVGKFLVQQYNDGGAHVNPLYRNQLQAGMRAAKMEGYAGEAMDRSYAMYKQLSAETGGKATAMAYLGDDAVRMMKYDQFIQGGKLKPEVAYQLAFGEPLDTSRKSSDKEIGEAIVKTVDKDQPGFWSKKLLDTTELTDQSKRVLTTAVGRNYDLLAGTGMDDKAAMATALDVAKKEMDVVGPYIVDRGPDRKPIYQLIGADEAKAGEVFTRFLNERARANGVESDLPGGVQTDKIRFSADLITSGPLPAVRNWFDRKWGDQPSVMINRLPDQNGVGVFAVTVVEPDGNTKFFPITSDEVRSYYEKSKDFK